MASAVCSGVISFNDVILAVAEVEEFVSVFDIKLLVAYAIKGTP
jgi:hypothetical protein